MTGKYDAWAQSVEELHEAERYWAKGEVVADEEPGGEPDLAPEMDDATAALLRRPEAGPAEPDGAQWEQGLSAAERAAGEHWEVLARIEAWDALHGRPRRHCRICKLEKPIISSGRCETCKKYAQRHGGVDRPLGDVLAVLERTIKKSRRR